MSRQLTILKKPTTRFASSRSWHIYWGRTCSSTRLFESIVSWNQIWQACFQNTANHIDFNMKKLGISSDSNLINHHWSCTRTSRSNNSIRPALHRTLILFRRRCGKRQLPLSSSTYGLPIAVDRHSFSTSLRPMTKAFRLSTSKLTETQGRGY